MDRAIHRPLIIRVLKSWVFWAVMVLSLLAVLAVWSSSSISSNVTDSQAQFVADNVRRSAVQCYAIEGRFPTSQEGVKYLEEHYGLAIDHTRYQVYYESFADNIIPQIRVVATNSDGMTPAAPHTAMISKERELAAADSSETPELAVGAPSTVGSHFATGASSTVRTPSTYTSNIRSSV